MKLNAWPYKNILCLSYFISGVIISAAKLSEDSWPSKGNNPF